MAANLSLYSPSSCSVCRGGWCWVPKEVGRWRCPLPRGRGPRLHQPPRPGHGPGRVPQLGRSTSEGCRGRSHSVAGCASRDRLSVVTVLPGQGRPTMTEHWKMLGVARSALTQNCLGRAGAGHDWEFWQGKSEAGGASRLPTSWSVWRKRKLWLPFLCCGAGSNRPTSGGGARLWPVRSSLSASLLDRRPVQGLGTSLR